MIAFPLGEGHLQGIGGEGGMEDVSLGELGEDVSAPSRDGHKTSDNIMPLSLGELGGLFGLADVFALTGVILCHRIRP